MRRRTLTIALMMVLGGLGAVVVLAQRPDPGSPRQRARSAPARQASLEAATPPATPENPPSPLDPPSLPPAREVAPSAPGDNPPPFAIESEPPPAAGLSQPLATGQPPLDDPMQDVDTFVEQNRKRAAESIQRLTKEAEELRARLSKVEKALERWKALAGALEPEKAAIQSAVPDDRLTPVPTPSQLPAEVAPAPPRAPGRGD